MAGVITRSNHPDALWPGIKAWYGKRYKAYPAQWSQIFDKQSSDKAYEKVIETTGFGMAARKSEGSSISYDSDNEGTVSTFTHVVYGLGYIVTREEDEDDLYAEVSKVRSKALAFSMSRTIEVIHANVLNRAFSASYVGGDAVALCSSAHPTAAGNQSNLLTAADLSEASLEDGLKTVAQMTNARGLNIALTARQMIVSYGDMFNAQRILKSSLRSGTANNDINAVKEMGLLPGGAVVNNYLTDNDAWFLQTDVEDSLISFWRREAALEQDSDFDTENMKAKSTVRFSTGWGDYRGIVGNAGA